MVQHIEEPDEPRSGRTGIVVQRTSDTAATLDVIWSGDGVTTAIAPEKITLASTATTGILTNSESSSEEESVFAHEKSFYDKQSFKGFKPLLPDRIPSGSQVPTRFY